MDRSVTVITPAFRAQDTIVGTVRSVIAQTFSDWRLMIIADDGLDYEQVLAHSGVRDTRIKTISSGGIGRGASHARNIALDRIETPYAAILDADDRLKPEKLQRAVDALNAHAIVTTALDVMTDDFHHLRFVGDGPDLVLSAGEHKWISLSMDSMLVWDTRRADGRYDPTLSNMTDLEFLLQLYRTAPRSCHLGTPLHDYIKRNGSMSNTAGVAAGMIRSKTTILERLNAGFYGLPGDAVDGLAEFLAVSLAAEARFDEALKDHPGLLFEDHIEPMLARQRAAKAAAPDQV